MTKSAHIRVADCHAILDLVGECRELGDDPGTWRRHAIERLARMVDADLGFGGEMAGCLALRPRSLGHADWGWENGFDRAVHVEQMAAANARGPAAFSPAMNAYYRRMSRDDGVCHSRPDIFTDREWYGSFDYRVIH